MSGTTSNNETVNISDIMTENILSRQEAVAEALVFASGDPVKIESISIVLNVEKKEAKMIMEKLIKRYEERNGGIILRKIENSYQFCTKPELREDLRDFFEKPSNNGLSRAALETLSIICYNQPITRGGIEYVRGVNSDGVLVRLIEKGLVEECGRQEAPGRPILYGTTVKFLQSVGAESLKDLPAVQKIVYNEENVVEKDEIKKMKVIDLNTIKVDKKQVKMIAHRGLSGIETENSNCAFVAAGNRSHFGIETDVHRTLDGQYIIIHDDVTGRVSDQNISVEGSTFADLRNVKLRDREDGVTRDDLILPTLDDYIKICKRYEKKCVLELKNPMSFEDAENIVNIIKQRDYVENVIFISFDFNNLLNIRKILPSKEQKVQFLCGPLDEGWVKKLVDNNIDVDIHYPSFLNDPNQLKMFKEAGLEINCWTVDSKEDAEKLIELGVDYITSNILE